MFHYFRPPLTVIVTLALTVLPMIDGRSEPIVVCSACSHEAVPEARFCSHCGSAIQPGSPPATAPADAGLETPRTPEPSDPAPSSDGARTVGQDLEIAGRFMTDPALINPAVALAALDNARAVMAISEPGSIEESLRARVLRGTVAAREALSRTRAECPRCNGKGQEEVVQDFSTLDGGRTSLVSGRRACARCGGRGVIQRLRKTSEIQSLLGTGRQRYANEALLLERIRVGNAWVSRELAQSLSIRQQATLRHFAADPCSTCAGFGKTDCSGCDNTGFAACTAAGCDNGMIRPAATTATQQRERRIEASRITSSRPCPGCRGTGLTTCALCAGTASVTCRTCNGTGTRSACTSCKGEGVQPCRTCRGTGKDRDGNPCPMCAGEGLSLCNTCGGDGYGRR